MFIGGLSRSRWSRLLAAVVCLYLTAVISSACTLIETPMPASYPLDYKNPVYSLDFPDPFVLRVDDMYYAYATNARGMNVQVIRSKDMVNWERAGERGDALPQLPAWAEKSGSLTWAPSVLVQTDGFVLYYVTRFAQVGRQCISYATSHSPDGPFVDASDRPFICQVEEGGSIDPEPFTDNDGTPYLLWKSDGNCCNLPIYIYVQQLSEDGRGLVGDPVRLITLDQDWEPPLIENPSMVEHGGKYYLIYSANWWESRDYAVGYAVCDTPRGPCLKPQVGPILSSAGRHVGTGGAAFFHDASDKLWIAYHAWREPYVGYPAGMRRLYLARVDFEAGIPVVHRPKDES